MDLWIAVLVSLQPCNRIVLSNQSNRELKRITY